MNVDEQITIVTSSSAIPSHPSTAMFDQVYRSVRRWLPTSRWIVMFDGVHRQEASLAERYRDYIRRVTDGSYAVEPIVFEEWGHQSRMLVALMSKFRAKITTPLMFWIDHDLAMRDWPIDWIGIVQTLLDGEVMGLRFHLSGDGKPNEEGPRFTSRAGVPIIPTRQLLVWPTVARVEFFDALAKFLAAARARTFIGAVGETDSFLCDHSELPFGYYAPEGDWSRCRHLDGHGSNFYPWVEFNGRRRYNRDEKAGMPIPED